MNKNKLTHLKIKKTILLTSAILIASAGAAYAEDAKIWQKYIGTIADESIPLMPDYSYAGYKLGEQPIPVNHNGLDVFNIVNFGAIANDMLSDQDAIQQAINAAEANGGGVVMFPALVNF
ncbi:hypothetical protein L3081_21000 [Colwellia sp. MSW7]|uniref:Pectate lyase superfamily protein domain-containing protein n=1 Tax=Colwellia maritima TaxID=2912588 RepID=A0ABS9X5A9_9GAMM|nr:hypothetical protein [Colwellia maritima]MCI2285409.1 hypothetical protein [Colwellia maritima]